MTMKRGIRFLFCLLVIMTILTSCDQQQAFFITLDYGYDQKIETLNITTLDISNDLKNPQREHYIFQGWYFDDEYLNPVTWSTSLTQDITIYAKWEKQKVTLSIQSDNESFGHVYIEENNAQSIEKEIDQIVHISAIPNEGYEFVCWKSNDVIISENSNYDVMLSAETPLIIAYFQPITMYQLSFEVNGGNPIPSIITTASEAQFEEPTVPLKEGFHFLGWYYDQSLTQPVSWPMILDHNQTIYASWQPETYILQVSSEDLTKGDVSIEGIESLAVEVAYQAFIQVIAVPHEGYHFVCWMKNDEIVSEDLQYEMMMPQEDISLVAYFEQDIYYTISFHTFETGTIQPLTQSFLDEPLYEPEINSMEGKVFLGWYYDIDYQEAVEWPITPTTDLMLYAKWDDMLYTLHVENNTSISQMIEIEGYDTLSITSYQDETITVIAHPMNGYDFQYWLIDGNIVSTDLTYDIVMPAYSLTIQAVFQLQTMYNIAFDSLGGSYIGPVSQTYDYLTIEKPEDPVKDNHVFTGWYYDQACLQPVTWPITPTANTTLYAGWQANVVIMFDTLSTSYVPSIIVPYGTEADKPEDPVQEDYVFLGWYEEGNENDLIVWPITATKTQTLYAKWEREMYTLQFDSQDGTLVSSIISYTKGYVDEPTAPTKTNYEFLGWYENLYDEHEVTWPYYLDESVTLYAKWHDLLTYDQDFAYRLDSSNQTASIVHYMNDASTTLTIPEMVGDYTIVRIERHAFINASSLQSLIVPQTIEVMEQEAFYGLSALENLTLPFLGEEQDQNQHLGWLFAAEAFQHTYQANGYYVPNSLQTLTITNAQTLEEYALSHIKSIKELIISNDVTHMGYALFQGMSSLQTLEIPFTGSSRDATNEEARLGYLFGDFGFEDSYFANGYYVPLSLNHVTLTDTTIIKDQAFDSMSSLQSVTLPQNLTAIGNSSFARSGIIEISIPEHVTLIDSYAFQSAMTLQHVTFEKQSMTLVISDYAFADAQQLTQIILPEHTQSIGNNAFLNTALSAIVIPQDVISIGVYAFASILPLSSIVFEENSQLQSIGSEAFSNLPLLENMTIPQSVIDLGHHLFRNSMGLKYLSLPFIGLNRSEPGELGDLFNILSYENSYEAFGYYLPNCLETVIITDALSIADQAFLGAQSITYLELPETLTSIGEYAFVGMTQLNDFQIATDNAYFMKQGDALYDRNQTTLIAYFDQTATQLVLSDDLTLIKEGALSGNNQLTQLVLPFVGSNYEATGNQSEFGYIFGKYAYANSYQVGAYYLPQSLKTITITQAKHIGDYAFSQVSQIEEVYLPATLETIGVSAFSNMEQLREVYFASDSALTIINQNAFSNTSLSSLNLPNRVIEISYRAFANNPYLTAIEIPDSVERIDMEAFAYNENLEAIIFSEQANVKDIGGRAFFGTKIESLSLPNSLITMQQFALEGLSNLKTLSIPFLGKERTSSGNEGKLIHLFGNQIPIGFDQLSITDTTTIADYGLANFNNIVDLRLTEGLLSIGTHAFDNLSLTALHIPDSVTFIAESALANLANLTYLSIPFVGESRDAINEAQTLAYMFGTDMFENGYKVNDYYLPSTLTHLDINHTDHIAQSALYGTYYLTHLTLPFIGESFDAEGQAAQFGYIFSQGHLWYEDEGYTYWTPDQLKEVTIKTMSSIPDFAFYKVDSIESLHLPDTYQSIGDYALYGMTSLQSLTISSQVASIGTYALGNQINMQSLVFEPSDIPLTIDDYAFMNMNQLTSLQLPNRLETIGYQALNGMSMLSSLTLPFVGVSRLETTEKAKLAYLFGHDEFENSYLVDTYYIPLSLTQLTITDATQLGYAALKDLHEIIYLDLTPSESLISIQGFALSGLNKVQTLTLNDSIESIGIYALEKMSHLEQLVISNQSHLKQLDYFILNESPLVQSFYLPASVNQVEGITFANAWGLQHIDVDSNNADYCSVSGVLYSKNQDILYAYPSAKTVDHYDILDTVTRIDRYAFYQTQLVSIHFPNQISDIGDYAFYNANQITQLELPQALTQIQQSTFAKMNALTRIEIPENVTDIAGSAFYQDIQLAEIIFLGQSQLKTIGASFAYGSIIESLVIPEHIESIATGAFAGLLRLSSLTMPFIGTSQTAISPFVATFGYQTYDDSYEANGGYLPLSLRNVSITNASQIPNSAFKEASRIEHLMIDGPITTISSYAFTGMKNLQTLAFGDQMTLYEIQSYAFHHVESLQTLHIDETISYIENNAFYDMYALTSVDVDENNATYYDMDGVLFNNEHTLLLYPASKPGEQYVIPETTIEIANNAFSYNRCLQNLTITNQVEEIGSLAFGHTKLKNVEFEEDALLSQIPYSAFYQSSELVSIHLPASITSIEAYAFYETTSLQIITIEENAQLTDISMYAFYGNSSLENIDFIHDTQLSNIHAHAFENATSLTHLSIPESVVDIEEYAFRNATSLIQVTFAENNHLYSLSNYVFANATSLPSITLPISMSLKTSALANTPSLEAINVEEGHLMYQSIDGILYSSDLTRLYKYPGGKLNTYYETPETVELISSYAFSGCPHLEEIKINQTVTMVSMYAFDYMSHLKSLTITNPNSQLATRVFNYLPELECLTIPFTGFSMNATGDDARLLELFGITDEDNFYNNFYHYIPSTLETIVITHTETLKQNALSGFSSVVSVELPSTLKTIEGYAFASMHSLLELVIPEGVTSIGEWAFAYDTALKKLVIPNSVVEMGSNVFAYMASIEYLELPFVGNSRDLYTIDVSLSQMFGDTVPENLTTVNITDMTVFYRRILSSMSMVQHLLLGSQLASIEPSTFNQMTHLESIEVDEANTNFITIDGVLYTKDLTTLVCYPQAKDYESFIIPNEVVHIESYAFYQTSNLLSIAFENNTQITEIGVLAFNEARSVENLILPDTVETINDLALAGMTNLTSIIIPESVTMISDDVFIEDQLTIYVYMDEKPASWGEYWHCGNQVVWGYDPIE